MSEYFYIVSKLNGYVVTISDSQKGGHLVNSPRTGGCNQLWRWNERSMLVSKLNLVADIAGENPKPEAEVIAWCPLNQTNQKWRFEEGMIRSNMNNLVLDVQEADQRLGKKITMREAHGGTNQKWVIIPEAAWDDFENLPGDALSKASFWKNLADNYLQIIIGYSKSQYEGETNKSKKLIEDCANQLDKVAKDTGIAETVGGGVSIFAGGLSIAGLIFAPFTAGTSLALTAGGALLAAGGGTTSLTANVINQRWEKGEAKKVKVIIEPLFRATFSLQGFLQEYLDVLKSAKELLGTQEGEIIARDAYNVEEIVETGGKVAWRLYKIGDAAYQAVQNVKRGKEIKALVNFIQADYYFANGARIGLATHAAAPGLTVRIPRLFSRTLVTAGTTSARVLSSSLAVIGISFGIWDVVAGGMKIANGSELANEFRRSGTELGKESEKLIGLCNELDIK